MTTPPPHTATTALRIGNWCVKPLSGQLSKDGEVVPVEARTLRLLVFLAERAGEVVSVDELLDQVWSGVVVTPDSVYQAVAALRRTLGDDPKQPTYIATVPRLGYRLIAPVSPWSETQAAPRSPPPVHAPVGVRGAVAAGAVLVVLIVTGAVLLRHARPDAARQTVKATATQTAVAVLPFLDLTEDMDQEYFADGMTESLIDRLAKLPGLRVPPPRSSYYYKDKQLPITEIAGNLHVSYVLDGSIRKSGTTIRVTARLVRADDGFVAWSETYDRPTDDLLMIQDDIAAEVAKAFQPSIERAQAASER